MTTILVIQARMTSSRLPGKVLLPLAGRPLLERLLARAGRIVGIDGITVAIPEGDAHRPIADLVHRLGSATVTTGDEQDVLARTLTAAHEAGADTLMRITSDCPLFDPAVSSAVLGTFRATGVPYARTHPRAGFPLGFDTEVIAVAALEDAVRESTDAYEHEHVTPFVWRRPERYPAAILSMAPDLRGWRLVVDEAVDHDLADAIYQELLPTAPAFGLPDLRRLFKRRPELLATNADVSQHPYLGLPSEYATDPNDLPR